MLVRKESRGNEHGIYGSLHGRMSVKGLERLQRTLSLQPLSARCLAGVLRRQVPPFMAWQPPAWVALSGQAPKPARVAPRSLLQREGLTGTARAKRQSVLPRASLREKPAAEPVSR
jgi:hypothetical protein